MKPSLMALLVLALTAAQAQVIDDFSAGWKPFATTPGKMTAEAGKLHLVDDQAEPDWYTVSKVLDVNFDQNPWFLAQVTDLSDRGTIKLIRKNPDDKQTVFEIDRPGLYAIDLRQRYKWGGSARVEVCLYAAGSESEITYEYVKFAAALTPEEQAKVAERVNSANPKLTVADFELVPTFQSCSVYYRSPELPGLGFRYRRAGGAWEAALPPVYVREDAMYRGSLVRLDEGADYEVQVTDAGGGVLQQGTFRTWSSTVPIARTVVLDETSFDGSLRITDKGSPEGWIKYTAKEGFVLRNDRQDALLDLVRAQYVVLEGLTLRGGQRDAVILDRCENVRVVNCDIAGWGRPGTQRFDLNGMYYTPGGEAINWDTAIRISRCKNTVIERCYIHDPVTTANSWYYAHPAGPQALGIDRPQSTVIRYNDFVGSDEHRWNDAIEGAGNFDSDGGFNRDADIYGEFHCFANDDAIEIDGGQINVRVFDNKYEGCLCGVSIQGCMAGPSYVFDNLLVNMGDERGHAGQTIKTSSNQSGPSAVSFILGNTTYGNSSDLSLLNHLKVVAYNNLFAAQRNIGGRTNSPQSVADYNLQARGTAGEEPHGLVGEPMLLDPQAGRFELADDSPAIGA
ncbi:MAG: hypothetical protein HUU35_15650, partial [Armatimonadetes bacterium]|nr:hypothetical protein [Armatimonadota bacterium]